MADLDISSSPLEQLYIQLQSSEKGLPEAVAEERMKGQARPFHPENRFKKGLRLILRQFSSPLVLLLITAIVLSIGLGEYSDSFIILFILLATGLLGSWQELKAGRAIEQLQRRIEIKHTVVREGKQIQLLTAQIVPGDVLLFDAGDMIAAIIRKESPVF